MTSVIIINYNTFELTCECIRSVISKTTIDYEIILVDNASTECDPKDFLKEFPSISLIEAQTNLGFSRGNNLGIKHAKGDFILLLNSDTLLLNNAIDSGQEKLQSDKKIGALTGQLVSVGGDLQQASFEFMPMYKLIACTFKVHWLFPWFKANTPDLTREHFSKGIWGTFFFFPRKILDIFQEKKLPETFFMYVEDLEWSYYIASAGYKLLYYPSAKILHYGGGSNVTSNRKLWENSVTNEYVFLKSTRGKFYATAYFLSKSLFYLSCFDKTLIKDARYLSIFALKNLKG